MTLEKIEISDPRFIEKKILILGPIQNITTIS